MIEDAAFKALVVDDRSIEGLPITLALWRNGLDVSYYRGREEELPPSPLTGVRLVLLDIVLEGPSGAVPKDVVSTCYRVLSRLIDKHNGPYILITWSSHPVNVSEFCDALESAEPIDLDFPKPAFVFKMDKTKYLDESILLLDEVDAKVAPLMESEGFNYSGFVEDLESKLMQMKSYMLLLDWEKRVSDARSMVLSEIWEAILDGSMRPELPIEADCSKEEKQKSSLNHLLASLVRKQGGPHRMDWKRVVLSLSRALTPLVQDRTENRFGLSLLTLEADCEVGASRLVDDVMAIDMDSKTVRKFNSIFASRLNGMLQVDLIVGEEPCPGNVYLASEISRILPLMHPEWGNKDGTELFRDEILDDLAQNGKKKELEECSEPIVVDTTPLCDYVEQKMRFCQLVGGLIVPASEVDKIKKCSFGYRLLPVSYHDIDLLTDESCILLDSHFVTGCSVQNLEGLKPAFRLSQSLLLSINAWLGGQIGRPGYLSFR